MNKTKVVGMVVILILLGFGLVSALAYSANTQKSTTDHHDSEQGLTNEQIRDGLINHGVNHKEGEN